VITELTPTLRCIAPTLPLGAHRQPMRPRADLSIDGTALLVAEFLEQLDLHDVTLIMNDWGGPQLLVYHNRTERIGRLVLVACEAFDNFPPAGCGGQLGEPRFTNMIYPPIVSPIALTVAFLLAIFKPWGRIRRQSADGPGGRIRGGRTPRVQRR
jgi:pimeloyl-ACP methyl ester carboxylesterase